MTNKLIYLVIFLFTFLSCKDNNKTKSEHLEKQKSQKIDSLALRYLKLNRFSGTILVAKDKEVLYNQSFGLADYENKIPFTNTTAFKIGEISELITEDILNRLIKENNIQLTDKLSKYLDSIETDITISDIINDNSDINSNIKGRLIEKASKKSYQENIDEYSSALNLENTYFQKSNSDTAVGYLYHNYRGNGLELQRSPTNNLEKAFSSKGLKSTASDLVKILNAYTKEINIHGYLENDGFSYSLAKDPKNNLTIVVLSNRRHPVVEEMSNSIKAILEDKDYKLPLPREPYNIDKTILKQYLGHYALNERVKFEIQNSNDSLFVIMGPNKIYLVPQSPNQFYMNDMDASMRFIKDSTGLVNKVVLLNGFIDSEQIANRIK